MKIPFKTYIVVRVLLIHAFLIIFFDGCTKEIISTPNSPELNITSAYFDYNTISNQMYFYAEIENITQISTIDSVKAYLYNSQGEEIESVKLYSDYPDSIFNISEKIYHSTITVNDLQAGVYKAHFIVWDSYNNRFQKYTGEKFFTTHTEAAAPQIISYSVPDSFLLHQTDWTLLKLELTIFDENGKEDLSRVEYKTLRIFNGCTEDNNNDDTISGEISDDEYTNLGFPDWLFEFEKFVANNNFKYNVEIPMRPFNGAALLDSDGNVVPNFEATDCGRTGDVFFQFLVTDRSGLTAVVEDIHLEVLAP